MFLFQLYNGIAINIGSDNVVIIRWESMRERAHRTHTNIHTVISCFIQKWIWHPHLVQAPNILFGHFCCNLSLYSAAVMANVSVQSKLEYRNTNGTCERVRDRKIDTEPKLHFEEMLSATGAIQLEIQCNHNLMLHKILHHVFVAYFHLKTSLFICIPHYTLYRFIHMQRSRDAALQVK